MFQIGVDSYCYHRLLGNLRPGEPDPAIRLANGGTAVLREAHALGVEFVSLETMFLGRAADITAARFVEAAEGMEIGLSWGGNEGVAFGDSPEVLEDLFSWLDVASALQTRMIRVVVGGPRLRGTFDNGRRRRTAAFLQAAVDRASAAGVVLSLENHGDLASEEIFQLFAATERPELGICFDSANALRLGDDPLAMLERFLPSMAMVHLKDCRLSIGDPVAGPVSVAYGQGVIPVESIVDQLLRSGFRGPVCVELGQLDAVSDERELVRDSVAWLSDRRASFSS